MSFSLSEDHEAFRKVVRDFAEKALQPNIERWEREVGGLPTEAVKGMADLGLFGLTASEEYGGAGADLTTLCVAIEEIGRVDQSLGITLSAGVGLGANPIYRFGSEEQ
jgi:butyryl-CoA dehydrogenase